MAEGPPFIDPLVFDDNIADSWLEFKKEWHLYSSAALSDKSKKVQAYTLLHLAGAEAIEKAETFVYSEGEDQEDPDTLIRKFDHICLPEKNVIMDRYAFNSAVQSPCESIQSYAARLKRLAKKCEYGDFTSELIRDRIVCGIYDDVTRIHLLWENTLTLETAINICMLHERSRKLKKSF